MIAKLIPLALAAALAGCAAGGSRPAAQPAGGSGAPAAGDAPASAPTPAGPQGSALGETCNADPVQHLVGSKLTPAVTQDARAQSSSAYTRVLRPGQVMTMEYNAERLTIVIDGQDVITRLHCG